MCNLLLNEDYIKTLWENAEISKVYYLFQLFYVHPLIQTKFLWLHFKIYILENKTLFTFMCNSALKRRHII